MSDSLSSEGLGMLKQATDGNIVQNLADEHPRMKLIHIISF
jgi:hypothetical protein